MKQVPIRLFGTQLVLGLCLVAHVRVTPQPPRVSCPSDYVWGIFYGDCTYSRERYSIDICGKTLGLGQY